MCLCGSQPRFGKAKLAAGGAGGVALVPKKVASFTHGPGEASPDINPKILADFLETLEKMLAQKT